MQKIMEPLWGGLTRKLLVSFGGVLLMLLVMAVILGIFLTNRSRVMEKVLRENYNSVRYCDDMKKSLDEAQALAQAHPKENPRALSTFEKARQDFLTNSNRQLGNTYLKGELEASKAAADSGQLVFTRTYTLLTDASITDPTAYYRDEIFPEYQRCRDLIGNVSQMNLDNFVRVNTQVQGALLAMRSIIVILLVVGVFLSTVFVVATARGMIRPLKQLRDSVHQIETGNLDLLIESNGDDEIGQLALAFNEMAARLREFRKLDHEKLIRIQQTTQVAIDSLPDAVAVMDAHGTIEIANKTAQVHFQLTPGASIHAIRPDWAAMFFEPILRTKTSVVPDGYRSAIQIFDESGERFLLPRAVPMLDPQGDIIGVTLILVEITHLRKADEFKSGLLSAVSHELKTPLTSIRMAMRMLLDKRVGSLNPQQQTLLDAARTDSERLVRSVEDILTIGRVEAGRTRLDKVDLPASDIATRAIATVEAAAGERAIQLIRDFAEPSPVVHADLNLTSCALSNLLSNAIKYSPTGSTVKLTVAQRDECVEFSVQDQGPGIPAEYQKRIFEKFVRIPTAGGPSGVGLGLTIASEIAQLHSGTINLAATSPGGSTFVMTIPLREPDSAGMTDS